MRRAAILVATFTTLTASAAWAAYTAMPVDDLTAAHEAPETIVIKVPAADLERCRATLASVMSLPVEPGTVAEISYDMTATPTVRCEAE